MKQQITNDHDNAGYTESQAKSVLNLLSREHLTAVNFKRIECFQYDGLIFKGNYDCAVNGFVKQQEFADFLAYLKDTHYQFTFLYE